MPDCFEYGVGLYLRNVIDKPEYLFINIDDALEGKEINFKPYDPYTSYKDLGFFDCIVEKIINIERQIKINLNLASTNKIEAILKNTIII